MTLKDGYINNNKSSVIVQVKSEKDKHALSLPCESKKAVPTDNRLVKSIVKTFLKRNTMMSKK